MDGLIPASTVCHCTAKSYPHLHLAGEVWRPIPDYPAYLISCFGRVRRILPGQGARVGHLLKSSDDKEGYQQISLGRGTKFKVHRLVLRAFVGPCPEGHEASHEDDDPRNNELSNLSWQPKATNLARRRLSRGDDWRRAREVAQ